MYSTVIVLDSVTHLTPAHHGQVIVAASHGGLYSAQLAAAGGARAVILNDAGVGLDNAGIAGLELLDAIELAAATVSHLTARIGDGQDTITSGIISAVNTAALSLGCRVGQPCRAAVEALRSANPPVAQVDLKDEARRLLRDGLVPVWGLDSASLVSPDDANAIVVTGSHGALLGGRAETALKYSVMAAVFHDAGIGKDGAGVTRLPALASRKIPAVAVAAKSARIGDARSMWQTGIISTVNSVAAAHGAFSGMDVKSFADLLGKPTRRAHDVD